MSYGQTTSRFPPKLGDYVFFEQDTSGWIDGCGWVTTIPGGAVGRVEAIWGGHDILLEVRHSRVREEDKQVWVNPDARFKRVSALEALALQAG